MKLQQERDIRDHLGKLPNDLKDAYDDIYRDMNESERRIVDRAFQWVMCSSKPLSTSVLLPAVCQDVEDDSIQPVDDLDEDLLLEYCRNLLVIDSNREVWIPSHLSVIEYVENHLWSSLRAHQLVASVCLKLLNCPTYYNNGEDGELGNAKMDPKYNSSQCDISPYSDFYDLRDYAVHHWMTHIQKCEDTDINERVCSLLKQFLGSPAESSFAYQSWHMSISKSTGVISEFRTEDFEPTSLASFAICAFGFYTILSPWWEDRWEICMHKNVLGGSLLQLAVVGNSAPVCARLSKWGARVDEQIEDSPYYRYGCLLGLAASHSNREVVKVLLQSGADANTLPHVGNYGSALIVAAISGNYEVAKLLLESGADIRASINRK